jgi:hypothetical protein
MSRVSRFWATNAIFLGVWEAVALLTKKVPTISITAARARQRWPFRTLIFLVSWASGLISYLYTKKI